MPTGSCPRAAQALERGDGVRHPAAHGVDGVDEQQGVVGIDVGVGVERRPLALPEGDEQLDHRVGVGPGRRPPELVGDGAVGRRRGATDDAPRATPHRPPPRRRGASRTRAPGRPCAASTTRAALVAMSVAKLSWLSSGVSSTWAAASGPSTTVIGVLGCTTRPSGTASMRSDTEVEVGEPRAERVVEQALAATAAMAAQGADVDRSGVDGGRPRGERSEAGRHAVAGLVVAVVGVAAEEVLEAHTAVVHARAEVQLGHRQLVGVGAEDAAPQRPGSHGRTLRPSVRAVLRRYLEGMTERVFERGPAARSPGHWWAMAAQGASQHVRVHQ